MQWIGYWMYLMTENANNKLIRHELTGMYLVGTWLGTKGVLGVEQKWSRNWCPPPFLFFRTTGFTTSKKLKGVRILTDPPIRNIEEVSVCRNVNIWIYEWMLNRIRDCAFKHVRACLIPLSSFMISWYIFLERNHMALPALLALAF